jgi:hypothetical protein
MTTQDKERPRDEGATAKSLFGEALERYSQRSLDAAPAATGKPPVRPPLAQGVIHLESEFFEKAGLLRDQFEKRISSVCGLGDEHNCLTYVFTENAYQLLTAPADQIFEHGALLGLMERIRTWANQNLGIAHVSSPQVRLYVNGCWRGVLRDDINASWHYLLSLYRGTRKKTGRLKIVTESASDSAGRLVLSAARIAAPRLSFNDFLVHGISAPYGVELVNEQPGPLNGALFLEGYIW